MRGNGYMKALRRWLIVFLVLDLVVIGVLWEYSLDRIPNSLYLFSGDKKQISLPAGFSVEESKEVLKTTNQDSGFSMASEKLGTYQVPVKFFGLFQVKKVNVKVIREMKVVPSGEPIGIYVETKGLLVLGCADVQGKDGLVYSPGKDVFMSGDYIVKWDGENVSTIAELNKKIQKSKGKKTKVAIKRGKKVLSVLIKPVLTGDNMYKIGTWVREDTQGIGTLTYVTEEGDFGTLGHGIADSDTGTLLNLKDGELYQTRILGITKGQKGKPGELQGYINMVAANQYGKIEKNTEFGVFGKNADQKKISGELVSLGMKQEIKTGKAYILSSPDGTTKKYEIEIEQIYMNRNDNKSMIIHITDPELLKKTGGIVQGMSGSPILQNGKMIGAVTHVFVKDPTRGYGVFIENMIEASK